MEHGPEGHQEFREGITAQKAVIMREGKYLILKRAEVKNGKPNPFAGLYDFAGGKPELDEELEAALKREVKEETGLDVEAEDVAGVYPGQLGNTPVKFIIYAVKVLSRDVTQVRLSGEHTESRWVTVDELRSLPTMPYMESYLNDSLNT
jgi:8-oxo-dGTP diphosphatase